MGIHWRMMRVSVTMVFWRIVGPVRLMVKVWLVVYLWEWRHILEWCVVTVPGSTGGEWRAVCILSSVILPRSLNHLKI